MQFFRSISAILCFSSLSPSKKVTKLINWGWEDLTPCWTANKIPQISRNPGKLILPRWGQRPVQIGHMTTTTWIRFAIYFSLSQWEQSHLNPLVWSWTDCFWGPDRVDGLPGPWTRHVVTISLGFARKGFGSKERDGCIREIKCLTVTSFDFGLLLWLQRGRKCETGRGGSAQLRKILSHFIISYWAVMNRYVRMLRW